MVERVNYLYVPTGIYIRISELLESDTRAKGKSINIMLHAVANLYARARGRRRCLMTSR